MPSISVPITETSRLSNEDGTLETDLDAKDIVNYGTWSKSQLLYTGSPMGNVYFNIDAVLESVAIVTGVSLHWSGHKTRERNCRFLFDGFLGETNTAFGSYEVNYTTASENDIEYIIDFPLFSRAQLRDKIRLAIFERFTGGILSMTITATNIYIQVDYEMPPTYSLSVNTKTFNAEQTTEISENGGTVSISGVSDLTEIYSGETAILNATANTDYTFVGWYLNDSLYSTNNQISLTITDDVSGYAKFRKKFRYNITVDGPNGTITGFGTYVEGATVTLNAVPNQGYVFLEWSDGIKNASRSFTASGNATYTAIFDKIPVFTNININPSPPLSTGQAFVITVQVEA